MKKKKNIYFTLSEYKNNYQNELDLFRKLDKELPEEYFLNEQIKLYKLCLRNTEIVRYTHGGVYSVRAVFEETEQIREIMELIGYQDSSSIDEEKTESLFYSFLSILDFIIDKKKKLLSKDDFNSRNKSKEVAAKYYALLHWILISLGKEAQFEFTNDDKYPRGQIESFARNRYPHINAQGFYRAIKDIDLTQKESIAREFGKGYKDILISISNNDADVMSQLKKWPS